MPPLSRLAPRATGPCGPDTSGRMRAVGSMSAEVTTRGLDATRRLRPVAATLEAADALLEATFVELAESLERASAEGRDEPGFDADEDPRGATGALGVDLVGELADRNRNHGKRLRPVLAHWGWVVAGGGDDTASDLARVAAALELLHLFALIQDDVMDRSDSRRGRTTLHVDTAERHRSAAGLGDPERFGDSVATLVSDLALSEATLLVAPTSRAVRAAWRLMAVELVEGQLLDLTHTAGRRRDLATARRIARFKSGRYTISRPLQLGALVGGRGGRPRPRPRGLGRPRRRRVRRARRRPRRLGRPGAHGQARRRRPALGQAHGAAVLGVRAPPRRTPGGCSPTATPAGSTTPASTRSQVAMVDAGVRDRAERTIADPCSARTAPLDGLGVDPAAGAAPCASSAEGDRLEDAREGRRHRRRAVRPGRRLPPDGRGPRRHRPRARGRGRRTGGHPAARGLPLRHRPGRHDDARAAPRPDPRRRRRPRGARADDAARPRLPRRLRRRQRAARARRHGRPARGDRAPSSARRTPAASTASSSGSRSSTRRSSTPSSTTTTPRPLDLVRHPGHGRPAAPARRARRPRAGRRALLHRRPAAPGSSASRRCTPGVAPAKALALFAVITYMDTVAGVFHPEGGMHAVPRGDGPGPRRRRRRRAPRGRGHRRCCAGPTARWPGSDGRRRDGRGRRRRLHPRPPGRLRAPAARRARRRAACARGDYSPSARRLARRRHRDPRRRTCATTTSTSAPTGTAPSRTCSTAAS